MNDWVVILGATTALLALTLSLFAAILTRRSARNSYRELDISITQQERLIEAVSSIRMPDTAGIDRSFQDINAHRISSSLDQIAYYLSKHSLAPVTNVTYNTATESGGKKRDVEIVGEVSHSLNTPLQQIELTLSFIKEFYANEVNPFSEQLINAIESVDICRAVLTAYREISGLATTDPNWDVDDLGKSITHIVASLAASSGNDVELDLDVPSIIPGYGNYYIVAILLPILQNAFEASEPGKSISCKFAKDESTLSWTLINSAATPPDFEKMNTAGYTSKQKASPGIGLSSVRTLLARHHGSLSFSYEDHELAAVIQLPGRMV